jgi:hypothetical protein
VRGSFCRSWPSNKRLQLTPNSSFQSVRGIVLAADAVPQRWRSALLGAAEPHIRWAARAMRSILVAVACGVLLIMSCGLYAFLHNEYVHPLGRLHRSLSIGEPCDSVEGAFERYAELHASPSLTFTHPDPTRRLGGRPSEHLSRGIFLMDDSLFDPPQLTVWCDHQDRVAELEFVGD